MSDQVPYIFILDWDGTIAGKVDYQSYQFYIHNALKKHGFKPNKTHAIPPAFYPNAKLIRPGFSSFCKGIKEHFNNVYIFIYTASEKKWAHQEIAWVEKTHGIVFAKPIFTRDDCINDSNGNIRKSISKIFPKIVRTVSKLNQLSMDQRRKMLEEQTIIIDNNSVYVDRSDKLLLCPDYYYSVFENLLHGIPVEARKHPAIEKLIIYYINQSCLYTIPSNNEDGMRSLTQQYQWLAAKCKVITDENFKYENDDFWIFLRKLIIKNNIKIFTPAIIKQIQNAVWKHFRHIEK